MSTAMVIFFLGIVGQFIVYKNRRLNEKTL